MKYLYVSLFLILAGCVQTEIKSNAPQLIQNEIRSSVVKNYTNNEVWKLGGQRISYVETTHCQANYREHIPSKSSFLKDLKSKVQRVGGNALVFDSCIVSQLGSCNVHTLCRGTAYLVN